MKFIALAMTVAALSLEEDEDKTTVTHIKHGAGHHTTIVHTTPDLPKGITEHTHKQGNGVGNNHVKLAQPHGFHLKVEGDLYLRVGV